MIEPDQIPDDPLALARPYKVAVPTGDGDLMCFWTSNRQRALNAWEAWLAQMRGPRLWHSGTEFTDRPGELP